MRKDGDTLRIHAKDAPCGALAGPRAALPRLVSKNTSDFVTCKTCIKMLNRVRKYARN